jgi:hypothetical protein
MISFIPNPERITNGETLTVKLEIEGQINIKTHKGNYFNVVIKKNGGTLGSVTLYPLRFNSNSLEWEINPYSYGSDGTFTVNCIYQGSSSVLASTTFVVEPDCVGGRNVNVCNNLTSLEQANRLKNCQAKKQEVPIDYTGGCQIQKPGSFEPKEAVIKSDVKKINQPSELILTSKVQKAYRDC